MNFKCKGPERLKIYGYKNIHNAKSKQKMSRVAILISNKTDFRTKISTRDKEEPCIMIKGSIRHNNNKSIYVNNRASKNMEQNLTILKGKITNSKILIGRKRKRLDQQEQVYQQSSKKKTGKCDHLCRVLNIRPTGNVNRKFLMRKLSQ